MLIIGAKGFAKESIHVLSKLYPDVEICFFDDVSKNPGDLFLNHFAILKTIEEAKNYFKNTDKRFVIGVGKPQLRERLCREMEDIGGEVFGVISITANIGKYDNHFGEGVIVMDNVIVETSNIIGKGSLIHAGSFISHDVVIGDFCEISPYVKLLGNVHVGKCCSVGTGAVILPGISIGNNVIIGAGAVVTQNIPDDTTAVGIPAKPLEKK